MARTREIKKRMVAVGTIQRITKTMQMIATAKFTSAMQRAKATRPFSESINQLVAEVTAAAGDVEHPLISGPATPSGRELMLVISSDRGLCGAYNANVLRAALRFARETTAKGATIDLHTAGKKAVGFFRFQRLPISNRFTFGDKPTYEQIQQVAEQYIAEFIAGKYDAVRVASMKFISNARQVPQVMQLLPLRPAGTNAKTDAKAQPASAAAPPARDAAPPAAEGLYEFSPSSAELLNDLLPLQVKTSLFQAFNDAVVSEQVMRMVAMKAATDNAKALGKNLKRSYNRARQTQITTELMEVISGAAALA
jgi:F-type H+-transporting ATPase subunit gamma